MKRILGFVLLCVGVLGLNVKVSAAVVATYGGASYNSINEAILAAKNGGTVTLTQDTEESFTVSGDQKVTLDLNNHNITASSIIWIHGQMTITGTGTIEKSVNGAVIWVCPSVDKVSGVKPKLTVEKGVTIKGRESGWGIVVEASNKNTSPSLDLAELDFNGTVTIGSDSYAISGLGNPFNSPTKITIGPDAVINSESEVAIYHPQSGDLIINGGTVTGGGGVETKAGVTRVTGGIFRATGTVNHKPNSNGNSSNGYVFAAVVNNSYQGKADINIEGGQFEGPIDVPIDTQDNPLKYSPRHHNHRRHV